MNRTVLKAKAMTERDWEFNQSLWSKYCNPAQLAEFRHQRAVARKIAQLERLNRELRGELAA
jgi:hypothetical protein